MRTIELFSGAGGLSLGLEKAGFSVELAIDVDKDSCDTYQSIFPQAEVRNAPIEGMSLHYFRGKIDLVAGGPPCQPFSTGGKRLGSKDRRDLIPEFFRVVREVAPPLFLMENVPGLLTEDRRSYVMKFFNEMYGTGYALTYQVVNSADYGVPQKRRRLFVVGSRFGSFSFPKPTHGPAAKKPYETAGRYLSVERAIGNPNRSKVVYAKRPDIRPSPYDGHVFNGGGRPINLDGVCPTILASAGGNKTHFVDTLGEVPGYHEELMRGGPARTGTLPGARRLSIEESAIIQTFPPCTHFAGSRHSQYMQIGNAVPPLLAESLGRALVSLLLDEREPTPFNEFDIGVYTPNVLLEPVEAFV